MATFWKRIREIFYGELPEDDQEVGAIGTYEPVETEVETSEPIEFEGGVRLYPVNGELWIAYSGRLAKAGRPVYMHFGYGPGAWRDVREQRLVELDKGVHETSLQIDPAAGTLEFCFRTDIGDWDNNHGNNWSYPP